MKTFLQLVAQDLHSKIGNDLSRVAIVFPNKRASLFFNEHLASQSDHPIWSPAYVSISELLQQLSDQKQKVKNLWTTSTFGVNYLSATLTT